MFLNSTQEAELLKVLPGVKTKVLPPCTVLDDFLKVEPDYNGPLRLIRHSSQGDVKFDKNLFASEVSAIVESRSDVEIHLMPGPSFVPAGNRVFKYQRNHPPVPEFLSKGNLFWYSLPKGYMDMGPRVILEAMASGLPILADAWGGTIDRVTSETGWLCKEKEDYIKIIKNITTKDLEEKGKAAKEYAKKHFVPERWIDAIINF